ncbi:MAG: colicin V production family protein [Micavibrio sp.]|nr:colicin V production family protein [Micavibrio sp.]|tara:strand:+ start:962 stop:1696 length:735 start_codon:yes stop_codon:yes gene_type:complete
MIIDIVVAAVVIISAIISFLRGFIREILTIAGIIGGLAAAYFFGPLLAPVFQGWFGVSDSEEVGKLFDLVPMDILANVCAYATIFILFVIIISVISHLTAGAVKAMGLGPVDRTLGVVFGIARAVVLLGLLYLPFHLLMESKTKSDIFSASRTHVFIEKTAIFLAGFLPNSEAVEEKIEDVTKEAKGKLKDQLMDQDLLKGAEEKIKKMSPKEGEAGYKDGAREELEQLFKEELPQENKPNFNE